MSAPSDVRVGGAAGTDRALARYVARTVYPYSAYYRALLDGAGLGAGGIRRAADLARLPPTDLDEANDPGAFVLRPDLAAIRRLGSRTLAVRALLAQLLGSMPRFNREVIEPRFKPIEWLCSGGIPMGYSAQDLERLGGLGARWLLVAGVVPTDVLVNLIPPRPTPAYWILVQGARRARVAAAHLGPVSAATVADLGPSVLVGHVPELASVLAAGQRGGPRLSNLTSVLCLAEGAGPDPTALARLQSMAGDATVVAGWAPSGVRAVWTECRQAGQRRVETGALTVHTWPDAEIVEVVEAAGNGAAAATVPAPGSAGELLWTGLGWSGSAALRIRTGATAVLDRAACAACGRPGPRLAPAGELVPS